MPFGRKRFYEDWTEPHAAFEDTDADKLPDAISSIGRTAYNAGPAFIGDAVGFMEHSWRCRVLGNQVFLARTTANKQGWQNETLLFSVDDAGPQIRFCSLGFTIAGRPVVATERLTGDEGAPEIWIYFFNSLTQQFEFTNFGRGRSPICFLDTPNAPSTADVTVMYIVEDGDDRLVAYRLQRDRYLQEYEAVSEADLDVDLSLSHLLLGGWTDGLRVKVTGVVHDPEEGTYPDTFHFYSFVTPDEFVDGAQVRFGVSDMESRNVIIVAPDTHEATEVGFSLNEIMAIEAVIRVNEGEGVVSFASVSSLVSQIALISRNEGEYVPVWAGVEDVDSTVIVIVVPGDVYDRPGETVIASFEVENIISEVP
jgi:hypothetical protein